MTCHVGLKALNGCSSPSLLTCVSVRWLKMYMTGTYWCLMDMLVWLNSTLGAGAQKP